LSTSPDSPSRRRRTPASKSPPPSGPPTVSYDVQLTRPQAQTWEAQLRQHTPLPPPRARSKSRSRSPPGAGAATAAAAATAARLRATPIHHPPAPGPANGWEGTGNSGAPARGQQQGRAAVGQGWRGRSPVGPPPPADTRPEPAQPGGATGGRSRRGPVADGGGRPVAWSPVVPAPPARVFRRPMYAGGTKIRAVCMLSAVPLHFDITRASGATTFTTGWG
jgi:hypothetical protein